MKGHLRRRQEREVLAVSKASLDQSFIFFVLAACVLSTSVSFLTETYRDAERGGGQRDGGLEGQTGRGQKNRGTQKIPFTQT